MTEWLYLEDGGQSRTLSIPVPRMLFGMQPPVELVLIDSVTSERVVMRYQRTTTSASG